jgi:membrane-associated phospholipid phosphatase
MTGLALLVFWVLPVSPPRFALPGVVDIIAEHDILAAQPGRDLSSSANLTAMPSLHAAWSAWCAYVLWSARRGSHPRGALLAWLFPLAMVADVLATGNHYVLDVAGSAALIIASIAVATGWARLVDHRSKPTIPMTDPRDDPTLHRSWMDPRRLPPPSDPHRPTPPAAPSSVRSACRNQQGEGVREGQ